MLGKIGYINLILVYVVDYVVLIYFFHVTAAGC